MSWQPLFAKEKDARMKFLQILKNFENGVQFIIYNFLKEKSQLGPIHKNRENKNVYFFR